jgi:hypothetical protein
VEDKGLTNHCCRDMATSSVEEYRWMVEDKVLTHHCFRDMATSSVEEYKWKVEHKVLTHHCFRDMATSSVEEYKWMEGGAQSINPSLLQGHGHLQRGGVQVDGAGRSCGLRLD